MACIFDNVFNILNLSNIKLEPIFIIHRVPHSISEIVGKISKIIKYISVLNLTERLKNPYHMLLINHMHKMALIKH